MTPGAVYIVIDYRGLGVKYASGAGHVGFASLSRLGEATAAYEESLDQEEWHFPLSEEDRRTSSLLDGRNHGNASDPPSARRRSLRGVMLASAPTPTRPLAVYGAICAGVMSEAGV